MLPLLLAACAATAAPADLDVTRESLLMGTYARVTVSARDRETGLRLAGLALASIAQEEERLSTWQPQSEVSTLNHAPVGEWRALSDGLLRTLQPTFALGEETGYAFDPAIGALTDVWGIHGDGRWPGAAEREAARDAIAGRAFLLDPRWGRICRLHPIAHIDVGGFGKGSGLDRAAETLRGAGVERALLDLGGQLLALGGPFPVGVADPRRRDRVLATFPLLDGSVSTSGNSERARSHDGHRIGHILDPRTGAPADDFGSVTVIAATGLEADALSTALFVLGPEAGLGFAARHPGIEALFVVLDSRGRAELRATPGLARILDAGDFPPAQGASR